MGRAQEAKFTAAYGDLAIQRIETEQTGRLTDDAEACAHNVAGCGVEFVRKRGNNRARMERAAARAAFEAEQRYDAAQLVGDRDVAYFEE